MHINKSTCITHTLWHYVSLRYNMLQCVTLCYIVLQTVTLYYSCSGDYSGPRCETSPCKDEHCTNHGHCVVSQQDTAFCQCWSDYEGDKCQYSLRCPWNQCDDAHTEKCTMDKGTPTCECKKGVVFAIGLGAGKSEAQWPDKDCNKQP